MREWQPDHTIKSLYKDTRAIGNAVANRDRALAEQLRLVRFRDEMRVYGHNFYQVVKVET